MAKKEINLDELENVTGGVDYAVLATCPHCGKTFGINGRPQRNVGEGCDAGCEAQCPDCGNWARYI